MKQDLIKCILIGFHEGTQDRLNEDNEDYEGIVSKLPITGDEAQFAWEFGIMMGREDLDIEEEFIDEYLEQILYDSCSNLTIRDLK
jgi:phage major head subunit gpT-like protein